MLCAVVRVFCIVMFAVVLRCVLFCVLGSVVLCCCAVVCSVPCCAVAGVLMLRDPSACSIPRATLSRGLGSAPYNVFTDAGLEVTLSSIAGGKPPVDANSLAEMFVTEGQPGPGMLEASVALGGMGQSGTQGTHHLSLLHLKMGTL